MHSYFTRLTGNSWYVISYSIDPKELGGPNSVKVTEESSEYHRNNIDEYPEHKKTMENFISLAAKRHKEFEKIVKAASHHKLDLAKYINDYTYEESSEENLTEEGIEYLVSIMMEPYNEITTPLVSQMSSEEDKYFTIPTNRTVKDLINIIEKKYLNILKINFEKKQNTQNFWFISKNKEEPRLADRFEEGGSELEQPLAIARDVKKLHKKLLDTKNNSTVAEFLSKNSELRHIVRRVFIVEKFPYSEIQDNTIGKNIMPIDMLRLKLSFFGALKFDPRSDKWLRICMFQGAPLPDELKNYDEQWVYRSSN